MGNISIAGMLAKKFSFRVELIPHGLVTVDILLTTIDNPNEPQLEGVDSARENVEGIGPRVHQIELGQDANGPPPLGIHIPRQLEGFRVGQVNIGRADGEDDAEKKKAARLA